VTANKQVGLFYLGNVVVAAALLAIAAYSQAASQTVCKHRQLCFWVLHLQPTGRPSRPIARAQSLRHDTLEAELAGVAEHKHLDVQTPAVKRETEEDWGDD